MIPFLGFLMAQGLGEGQVIPGFFRHFCGGNRPKLRTAGRFPVFFVQMAEQEHIAQQQQSAGQRHQHAGGQAGGPVVKADFRSACRYFHRHKAHVDLDDFRFLAVYLCAPAAFIGNAEKYQPLLVPFADSGKAAVVPGEGGAGGFPAIFAVAEIGVFRISQLGGVLYGFHQAAVLGHVLVFQHQRFQQHLFPLGLGKIVILGSADVLVIAEAHGNVVLVFPYIEAVLVFVKGPAGHLGRIPEDAAEILAVVVVVKEPAHGQQAPQGIVLHFRPGTHVPGDAHGGVKLHNGAGHNAVEGLNGGNLPEHAGIVQRIVKVGAAIFQPAGNVHILTAVEAVRQEMVVGVFALGFAQRQNKHGIHHAHCAETGGNAAAE